ncbi:hypothetical protein CHH69_17385, partial [Terribacillus saccharophilus]|uniref:transcriptional regulator n=1 Tax=Terribacillus saccharophilus TaxID=361277 RepID=UPI000BA69901
SNLLKDAIDRSGFKLQKICEMLSETHDINISVFHLSRLQNGKVTPAGDKLNYALATVLNVDAIELQAAAYKDKIPKQVLERLSNSSA